MATKASTTGNGGTNGKGLVTANLTKSAHQYLTRLIELGAVEGTAGQTSVSPAVRPVLEALHHILAGGSADVKITQKGDAATVRSLNSLVKKSHQEADRVPRTRGVQPAPVLRV